MFCASLTVRGSKAPAKDEILICSYERRYGQHALHGFSDVPGIKNSCPDKVSETQRLLMVTQSGANQEGEETSGPEFGACEKFRCQPPSIEEASSFRWYIISQHKSLGCRR